MPLEKNTNDDWRALPEPGQLVEVRRRQWVVSDVKGSTFDPSNGQHLVNLSSLDEDALGEELQVIWQLEPGAQVLEKAGMPKITGWDTHERKEAFRRSFVPSGAIS
jgi:hypothetical protein